MPSSVLPRLGDAPLPDAPLPDLPPAPVPGKGLAKLLPSMRKAAKSRPHLRLPKRPPVTRAVESAPAVQRQQEAARPAVRAQRQQARATNAAAQAQRAQTTRQLRALRQQRAQQAAPTAQPQQAPPTFPAPVGGTRQAPAGTRRGALGASADVPEGLVYPGGTPKLYRDMTPDEQSAFLAANPDFVQGEADRKRGRRGGLNAFVGGKMGRGTAPRSVKSGPTPVKRRGRRAPEPAPVAPPDEAEAAPAAAPASPAVERREPIRARPRGLLEQMADAFRSRQRLAERGQLAEAQRELRALRERLAAADADHERAMQRREGWKRIDETLDDLRRGGEQP